MFGILLDIRFTGIEDCVELPEEDTTVLAVEGDEMLEDVLAEVEVMTAEEVVEVCVERLVTPEVVVDEVLAPDPIGGWAGA